MNRSSWVVLFLLLIAWVGLVLPQEDLIMAEDAYSSGERYYSDRNYVEAAKFYKVAADKGHSGAQVKLAVLHARGLGMPENMPEAVRYLELAAGQGNPQAHLNLGHVYINGKGGIPRDHAKAVRHYREAARQGLPNAQASLGAQYAVGEGVPRNCAEALYWLWKATHTHDHDEREFRYYRGILRNAANECHASDDEVNRLLMDRDGISIR